MARARPLSSGRRPTSDEQLAALRGIVAAGVESRPGVYRMFDEDGGVIYVGKSKRLRARLLSYFRCAPEDKGARLLRETRRIEWEYSPSEFAALLAELRLIKLYRPRFNRVMKRDDRHYAFIKVTRGPAPKLYVVRGSMGDAGGLYYGPFVGAGRLREAVRALSDALGLRDCAEDVKMTFSDQQELFPRAREAPLRCLRYEIKKCLGPCVAGCSAREYNERVRLARAFLEGRSFEPVERLREDMREASARLAFERAASLRNKLARLEALLEQFGRLRFALESLSFLYSMPGHGGEDRVYLIRRGSVRAEAAAPKTDVERARLERLAEEVFGPSEPARAPVPLHELDEVLLLSSWFRRFPEELARTRLSAALCSAVSNATENPASERRVSVT